MKKLLSIFLLISGMMLQACATVYTDENFADYQAEHSEVAILPFDVTIDPKNMPKDVNLDAIEASELEEGSMFQKQLYSQFLQRYRKGEYTVTFQDVDETNVLLQRNEMDGKNLANYTKAEIAEVLGVDAVISGQIKRSKPMGTGAAVASAFLLGYSATNEVNVNVTIHGADDGNLLWSYDHQVTGSLGSSPERLSKSLMKDMSRKFPYSKDD